MKHKNKIQAVCFTLLSMTLLHQASGQKIIRQSISSYGVGGMPKGAIINQTVGQPYSTSTFWDQESNIGFNPGFQQNTKAGEPKPGSEGNSLIKEKLANIDIYPNPASHLIHIGPPENLKGSHVKITNIHGQTFLHRKHETNDALTIDCQEWQQGIYLVTIFNPEQTIHKTKKLLITK